MVQAGPLEFFSWDTAGEELYCVWFTWQIFCSGVGTGVRAFCEKKSEASTCWTEPMPANSNMDPLLILSAVVVTPA